MQAAFTPIAPKDIRAGRLIVELYTEEVRQHSPQEGGDACQLGLDALLMPQHDAVALLSRPRRHVRTSAACALARRGWARQVRRLCTTRCAVFCKETPTTTNTRQDSRG